jgi:hypothetical protein
MRTAVGDIMRTRLVAVLTLALGTGAHADNFDFRYVARIGDLNSDSRLDIYLQHQPVIIPIALDELTIPIAQTRRQVGQFLLRQKSNGTFEVVAATASEVAQMSQWPKAASVSAVVGDFNRDLHSEIMLENLSSAIAGASDQLVFAPLTQGAVPLGVRAIDASISKFGTDLMASADNPSYFDSGWHVVNQYTIVVSLPTYLCNGAYYPDGSELDPDPSTPGGPPVAPREWLPNGGAGCVFQFNANYSVTIREWEWDPSGFSTEAFLVYRAVGGYYSATENKTIPANRVDVVLDQFESLFGVAFNTLRDTSQDMDIDPDKVLRRPPPHWLRVLLRVVTLPRVLTTVGGVLWPSDTTDDDSFEYHMHYGFREHAPLFAGGIKAWLGKPAYVTPDLTLTGFVAQEVLALPIKDMQDSPPDALYAVHVRPSIPRSPPQPVDPRTWSGFGLTRHRDGGGVEILLFGPTGPATVFGPFPIVPF